MSEKCEHINEDGTFKGGFDGCVLHMTACEGHSEESAKKICGAIAAEKAADARARPRPSVLGPRPSTLPSWPGWRWRRRTARRG